MNKAGGGDGIPIELFQILKDSAVKVLHSICQQIWKTQQWPQDWKRSVFTPIPKKGFRKGRDQIAIVLTTTSIPSHSYHSLCVLRTLDSILLAYKLQHPLDHRKSKRILENGFIAYTKALTVWITTNCGKFFKRWEYQTGSKWGKGYVKAVHCHPAYLLPCIVHHTKHWAGRSTSWNQDCWEKYQ